MIPEQSMASKKPSPKFTPVLECGHCGNKARMIVAAEYSQIASHWDQEQKIDFSYGDVFNLLECQSCKKVTLTSTFWGEWMDPGDEDKQVLYPKNRDTPQGVPVEIEKEYLAALKVASISTNAFGALVRRTLEMVCIDRKAKGASLFEQLTDLANRGEIPDRLVTVANKIRNLGNIGAHASLGGLSEQEVPILENLTRALLDYVYSAPLLISLAEARLQELSGKRKKKTS